MFELVSEIITMERKPTAKNKKTYKKGEDELLFYLNLL